jgi:starch synthase
MLPSLFEPCGLTQLYALRYGTVPIVRATGGLADTVHEYNPALKEGTGFLFREYSGNALSGAINRALTFYRQLPHWDSIRLNGMAESHSAVKSAEKYIEIFRWALDKH